MHVHLVLLLCYLGPLHWSVRAVYSPRILATRTVKEGATDFEMELTSLLQPELGEQIASIERVSFFKEEQAYPFQIVAGRRIVLRSALDREQVCRHATPCPEQCCKLLRIEVRLAGQQAREFYIRVLIDDVNDSPPIFENNMDLRYHSLSEEATVGYEIELAVATDADTPENGVREYSLADKRPDNATFDQHFQLIDASWPQTPKLRLTHRLDREETPEFAFILRAVDGGRPPLTGTLSVSIEVKDVNDQEPKIVNFQPGYTIRVNETDGRSRKIRVARFEVEDGDGGENGRVECRIKSSSLVPATLRAERFFEVKQPRGGHGSSGRTHWEITTVSSLDYEKVKNFSFHIVASDFGQPRLSTSVSVSVIVQNVDDHPIGIVFYSGGSPRQRVELLENGRPGDKIASVEVRDQDFELKPDYEKIQCSLAGGSELFRLQERQVYELVKEYDLRTAATFDREQQDVHRVTVVCRDSLAGPGASATSSATLTVVISDANDCVPEFSRPLYRGRVAENAARRSPVQMDANHQIRAIDRDAFPNNRVVYRLHGPDAQAFSINSQGEISVEGEIDYEKQRVYHFNVTAANENNESMSSYAAVVIEVADVNDNPPVIVDYDKGYRFSVQEELSDLIIGRINATDLDTLPENSRVRFRILHGGSGGNSGGSGVSREAERYFRVDSDTGEVRVVAKIDRERHQYFQFRVQAENPSRLVVGPAASQPLPPLGQQYPGSSDSSSLANSPSVTTVTVHVLNINDHAPQLCRSSSQSSMILLPPAGGGDRQRLSPPVCHEPPDPLALSFADSGIFVNQPIGLQDHKCVPFDYEVRDADEPEGAAALVPQAPQVTIVNVSEINMGRRLPVPSGTVDFHLDNQLLCARRLPAKPVEKEIYDLVIRVQDPREASHRRDYPCQVTILRARQPPQQPHNNGRQNVNQPAEGTGEKRHFVIIVTMVTVVVFIIVIVFAFVLFFYVRRFDRSLEKDYDTEGVTMPLRGNSATAVKQPVAGSSVAPGMIAEHAALLYTNSHHRDHCSPGCCDSSDGGEGAPGGSGGCGGDGGSGDCNDLGLETARRRYEIWCETGGGGGGGGSGGGGAVGGRSATLTAMMTPHQLPRHPLHRPSMTLQRPAAHRIYAQQQALDGSSATNHLPSSAAASFGVRKLGAGHRASSCDDLDILAALASPEGGNSSGSNGYQVLDPFAAAAGSAAFRTPQHQTATCTLQPTLVTYQRLQQQQQQQGTVSTSLRTSTEPLYSPKRSLKNTYFETSFV